MGTSGDVRPGPGRGGVPRGPVMAADALALVVFVVAGLSVHGAVLTVQTLARDLVPVLGAWYALAPLTGVYRAPGWASLLRHWALAVPAGVLLRQVLLGRPWGPGTLVFLAAAGLFTAVCLGAARAVLGILLRQR